MKRTVVMLSIVLMASSVYAWTFNATDDFNATWTSEPLPNPAMNPNGPWTYKGLNAAGAEINLVPQGGFPWSGQNGWGTGRTDVGFYGIFRAGWPIEPTKVLDVGITGHTPSLPEAGDIIDFVVPAFQNAGSNGVSISAILQVYAGDAARAQQIRVNGQRIVIAPADNLEYTGNVSLLANPGDVLRFLIGATTDMGGNGVGTFASFDFDITEAVVVPEPMTMALLGLGSLIALRKRS